MAYQTQTFTDNETVLTAAMMDHIEAGIVANDQRVTSILGEYNEYDPATEYDEGSVVVHGNKIYECGEDGTTGAWDDTKWSEVPLLDIAREGRDTARTDSEYLETLDTEVGVLAPKTDVLTYYNQGTISSTTGGTSSSTTRIRSGFIFIPVDSMVVLTPVEGFGCNGRLYATTDTSTFVESFGDGSWNGAETRTKIDGGQYIRIVARRLDDTAITPEFGTENIKIVAITEHEKQPTADDTIALNLTETTASYMTGEVGEQIGYTASSATTVFKNAAQVKAGNRYAMLVTYGDTISSENTRTSYIVSQGGVVLQKVNNNVAASTTVKSEFVAVADGFLYPNVDNSYTSIVLKGGPLYDVAHGDHGGNANLISHLCNVHGSTNVYNRFIEVDGCRVKKQRLGSSQVSETLCVSLLGDQFHYWNAGTSVGNATAIGQGLQDSDFVPAPLWISDLNAYILHIVTSWRSTTNLATNGRVMFFTKDANGVITPSNVLVISNKDPDYKVSLSWFVTQEFGYAVMNNGNLAFVYSNSNSQTGTDQEFCFSIENAIADMSYLAPMESATAETNHEAGELISYGNRLYNVTSPIAAGETLSSSNTVSTSVAQELYMRDNAIADRVQLTEQTLTDEQKAQARENIDAVGTDEMSSEFLCRMLFGNEDDWSVGNYNSSAYSATKTGRIITYKGNNTSNSGFQSVNLTGVPGAPHTARSGNFGAIALADTDFVTIPSILKAISRQSATYPVVLFLSGYMHYDRYNDDAHAGFTFDYVLRRYNTETETYEYTTRTTTNLGLINTPTTADGVDRISIAQLIPDGRGGDYVVNWDEWEEMAIFAMRRNRMFSGTMLLTPSLEIYGDQKPVVYSAEQTLTAAEQEQARSNIAAAAKADAEYIYMEPWQLVAKKYFLPDSSGNLTVRRNHITYTPSASQSSPAVRSLIGSYEGANTTLGGYTPTIGQLIPVSVFGDAIKIGFYLDAVGTDRYPRFAYKFCTVNGETVTPISGAQGSLPETAATGVLAETTAAVPDGATHVFFGLLYSNGYTENATYDMVYKVDKG